MAARANFIIDQGSTFSTTVELSGNTTAIFEPPIVSAASKIKKHYSSSNSYTFTTTVNTSTSDVTLSLTAEQTDAIPFGRYVYDLEIVDSANSVVRAIEGEVTITPSVTR